MRPNWPKLVILAPKTCTLVSFQFFAVNIGGTRSGGRVGARFRIFGGGGGGVARLAKLFAGCKLIGAPAPNYCQIITFSH